MKRFLIGLLFLFLPVFVNAETVPNATESPKWTPYLSANVAGMISDVKIKHDEFFDFGAKGSFAIGARKNRYRLELAYESHAEVSELFQILAGHTVALGNQSLRINGYYDYVSTKYFAMFIGAGVGPNYYDYTISEPYINKIRKDEGLSFIAGANTGLCFNVWKFSIDLGFAFDYITYPRVYSYGPNMGLRFTF